MDPTPVTKIGVNEENALWVESPWLEQREQTADGVEIIGNQFNLLGRIDRIVKFGDKRISLVRIEQDLLKHPLIFEIAMLHNILIIYALLLGLN